jgi:hypothetical protein
LFSYARTLPFGKVSLATEVACDTGLPNNRNDDAAAKKLLPLMRLNITLHRASVNGRTRKYFAAAQLSR